MPEYDRAEKRFITPFGTAEIISVVDPKGRFAVSSPKVGQWNDYVYFQGRLSTDKAEHEVASVVRKGLKLCSMIRRAPLQDGSHIRSDSPSM
jgi:hypothetical protein